MKKIIAIVAVLAAFSVSSKAQDGWGVGIGFRGDLTNICMQGPLYGGYLKVDYSNNELLGPVGMEIGLSVERLVNDQYEPVTGTTFRNGSVSLQLPVMFRYGWELGYTYLYVQAGPSLFLGLELSRGIKGSGSGQRWNLYSESPTGDVYNRFDVLAGGAVGIILNDQIRIQAGVDYGFVSRVIGTTGVNNVQLSVGVAYVFGS